MSVLVPLALTLMPVVPAGTLFLCTPGDLQVFAPANKQASYYSAFSPALAPDPDLSPRDARFQQLADGLPARLTLRWYRGQERTAFTAVTISDYDADAGTAKFTLNAEGYPPMQQPAAMISGTCVARAQEGSIQ